MDVVAIPGQRLKVRKSQAHLQPIRAGIDAKTHDKIAVLDFHKITAAGKPHTSGGPG